MINQAAKRSKFNQYFDSPVRMSHGAYFLSAELFETREEAYEEFAHEIGKTLDIERIEKGFVRFGFPGESVEDRDDMRVCWWGPVDEGKNTKPVWIYE